MILIDNKLLYVATPKTATQSVKAAIVNSGVKYEEYFPNLSGDNNHYHVVLSEMIDKWGVKESFCVERNWFERWLSGFTYMIYGYLNYPNLKPKFTAEDITNEFVYKTFDNAFVDKLYSPVHDDQKDIQKSFIYNPEDLQHPGRIKVLCSSNFWKSGKKCTFEFDFDNMNQLEEFFNKRFKREFNLPRYNVTKSVINLPNLVINDELKSFVYSTFEKRLTPKLL